MLAAVFAKLTFLQQQLYSLLLEEEEEEEEEERVPGREGVRCLTRLSLHSLLNAMPFISRTGDRRVLLVVAQTCHSSI